MERQKIIQLLNEKKITATEAAKIAGVARQTVYGWRGFYARAQYRAPRVDVAKKMRDTPRNPYEPITKWLKRAGINYLTYRKYIDRIKSNMYDT